MGEGVLHGIFSLWSQSVSEANNRYSAISILAALLLFIIDRFCAQRAERRQDSTYGLFERVWYVGRRLRFRGENTCAYWKNRLSIWNGNAV
jgi:hypothetical protein